MKALEAGRRGRSQELLTHGKKCFGHTKFLFKPCSIRVRFWIDDRDPWGSCAFYECGLEQFLRPKIRNRKRVANQADGFGLHKCILCPFPKFRIEVSEIIVLFVPGPVELSGASRWVRDHRKHHLPSPVAFDASLQRSFLPELSAPCRQGCWAGSTHMRSVHSPK